MKDMAASPILNAMGLIEEALHLIAAAVLQADRAGLAQTIYRTTDPLARWGIWESSNPRPRIAREGYQTRPVLTCLPTRYFVGAF